MSEEKGIAIIDTRSAMANALARYNLVVEYTKQVMKKDKDYGVIPGAGTKPTLLKPGAEKLCNLFQFYPVFVPLVTTVDFDRGLFYFQYRCELYNRQTGAQAGSGIGSCNSREKKYRYRNIPEKKASDYEKSIALRTETKNGQYGEYKVLVIENQDPADLLNTIDKMAQKRALIAATLIACNASEFFTQDIEDMDIIEGEFRQVEEPVNHNPIPAEHDSNPPIEQAQEQPKKSKSSGNGFNPIDALIEWEYAQDAFHAQGMLNKSPFVKAGVKMNPDKLKAWAALYRGWRDSGLEANAAAEKATANEAPKG